MSSITVLSTTQHLSVNPETKQVAVISAGPIGPTGLQGPTGPSGTVGIIANGSTADQTLSGADTYINGSALNVSGRVKAGTVIKWRLAVTKTAAGTATPVFTVRVGPNGTTADTGRLTFTGVAQTAATDTGWIEVELLVRSVSATGTIQGTLTFHHFNTTTGLANKAQVQILQSVSGTFDTTAATLIFGLSINPGASGVWTVVQCSAKAFNLT